MKKCDQLINNRNISEPNQVPQSAGQPMGSQAGNMKFASGKIAGIQSKIQFCYDKILQNN